MMNFKKLIMCSMLLLDVWPIMAQNWSELGTGANALNANNLISNIIRDSAGNIYVGGNFSNASGKRYVAKWNGTSWSEFGTGANALNANNYILSTVMDTSGNLYAAGAFTNTSGKQYVAKWNGTSWSELGTGTNALNANNWINCIIVDPSGNIYAGGVFTNASGKKYVAKWNGSSWSELGTGANALNANEDIRSIVTDPAGNIYAAGTFMNASGKQYVAKWNGTSWSELGIGNNALNANDFIQSIITDQAGNMYAAGYFTNASGKYYVAKWNGTSWLELGTGTNALNANRAIRSIIMDPAGNLYAAGIFSNASAKKYIAKWNGTSWSELGTGADALNANVTIRSIITDPAGNVYAGGDFTNDSGKYYVAKWSNSVVAVDSIDVRTVGNVASTITTSGGTLPMTAVVFPSTAGQSVSWSIVPVTGAASISTTGLLTAQSNGTVWAKAVSVSNIAKRDSLLITISNQTVISVDSIDVRTVGNVASTITTSGGTLPMTAVVFPSTAGQAVSWNIIPVTGTASISTTGLLTAQSNGTVWAKAVSVSNIAKRDSLLITISNQTVISVDSIDVRTIGNVAATITTSGGTLPMTAVVFPATAGQAVSWSIVPVTGTASINASGLVTAQSNGTVWAKALSVSNSAKRDSLLITISNQQVTGIEDQAALMGVKLYPNPAGHDLYLSIEKAHPAVEVIITDLSGRTISRSSYESNSLHHAKAISVREMAPGIYYLRVKGAAIDMVIKFVKQ